MPQHMLEIRVRPFRIALLVNKAADEKELLLAFELLSKIWGGRFGQVLPVDPEICDDLTAFRLGASRPEFVYGIGINDAKWSQAVHLACQPRKYSRLFPQFVKNFRLADPQNYLGDHYSVDHALIHLIRTRDPRPEWHRRIRLVSAESAFWSVFCGAMYGVHHQNLLTDYRDESTCFASKSACDFIALAAEFTKDYQQSWLDVTGHKLSTLHSGCGPLSPTVVLVRELTSDLSLFWNIRVASSSEIPAWVIPIPINCIEEPGLLDALKNWLLAFAPYDHRSNYCHVTSESVDEATCQEFARRLETALAGTQFEAVDFEPPQYRLPVVIPFEYTMTWPAEISGQTLSLQVPKPIAFQDITSAKSWVVDICKDLTTGRAVGELQLPCSQVAFELLNGPCPPSFEQRLIPRMGVGHDCINVVCADRIEFVRVHLPTAEELLLETLREYGAEPLADEKRESYLPVINRFGSLHRIASAFSGQSKSVFFLLGTGTKTHPEIQSACHLGKGAVSGESYTQRVEKLFSSESDRVKRIGKKRFANYSLKSVPEDLRLRTLLEFWADRNILKRHWKIGPCGHCRQQYFKPNLNIQKRVKCVHCGNRITLGASVPLGYTLQHAVRHAISEGIVPVVLTGRFLQNLSHKGFMWLPGVKYKLAGKLADVDLIALCNGHLVFCECKQLDQAPPDAKVWDEVVQQFLDTVEVAKQCRASLAILAAQVMEFPQRVVKSLSNAIGSSIPYLLLTNTDLEVGYREVNKGDYTGYFRLDEILVPPFPERTREPSTKSRTIKGLFRAYRLQDGSASEE
jgi:hypothetical protein